MLQEEANPLYLNVFTGRGVNHFDCFLYRSDHVTILMKVKMPRHVKMYAVRKEDELMIENIFKKLKETNPHLLSLMQDVREILEEKGLNDIDIYGKLIRLSDAKSNLELIAMTRFLDDQARKMLAERKSFCIKDLEGFYEISAWYV